jgi:hypothetical protein
MGVALAVTTLTPTQGANAGGPRGGSRGNHSSYSQSRGTSFSHGHYYSGRDHYHWTYRYYWQRYGCDCYYCPSTCGWYYWCEPRCCYYPVSYINYAPPSSSAAAAASSSAVGPTVVAPTIINNSTGPGVPQLPAEVAGPPGGAAAKSVAIGGNVRGVGPMN